MSVVSGAVSLGSFLGLKVVWHSVWALAEVIKPILRRAIENLDFCIHKNVFKSNLNEP